MKKSNLLLILFLALVAVLSAGSVLNDDASSSSAEATDFQPIYQAAIEDAMLAEEDEIYKKLVPIIESNTELQWMDYSGEK